MRVPSCESLPSRPQPNTPAVGPLLAARQHSIIEPIGLQDEPVGTLSHHLATECSRPSKSTYATIHTAMLGLQWLPGSLALAGHPRAVTSIRIAVGSVALGLA